MSQASELCGTDNRVDTDYPSKRVPVDVQVAEVENTLVNTVRVILP